MKYALRDEKYDNKKLWVVYECDEKNGYETPIADSPSRNKMKKYLKSILAHPRAEKGR